MVQEDSPKEIEGKKRTCSVNKKPQIWSKKTPQKKLKAKGEHVQWIKSHKCGPRRFPKERQAKRRSTCSSAFSVAGIAFAFFFVVVFRACALCSRARGFGWVLSCREERAGCGLWALLLSVRKCPPPSLCCLSIKGLPNCSRSLLFYSEVARNRCVGCKPWIPKALCCIHETWRRGAERGGRRRRVGCRSFFDNKLGETVFVFVFVLFCFVFLVKGFVSKFPVYSAALERKRERAVCQEAPSFFVSMGGEGMAKFVHVSRVPLFSWSLGCWVWLWAWCSSETSYFHIALSALLGFVFKVLGEFCRFFLFPAPGLGQSLKLEEGFRTNF